MFNKPASLQLMKPALLSVALALTACNDDDALRGPGGGHDHTETSAGRLVVGKADGANSKAVVFDLENRSSTSINLGYNPTSIYASPGQRYAVIQQAADGLVNFVDGGIFSHDDHVDVITPRLLSFSLSGARPAHYRAHEDQAALFYDGEGATPAKFELFTDASLGAGALVASQTLPAAVHGIAEPRPGAVLALDYSVEEATASPPAVRSYVKRFELHGDHFHDEGRFATPCENLHGGASNEDYSAFGCADGVLVIHQDGETFTDFKIATDKRITQIAAHHAVAALAGFAGDGSLYVIDPAARSATAFDWNGSAADVGRRQHAFDHHGEHLLILDNTGTLHVLEVHGDHFDIKGRIEVLAADSTAARIAFSAADDLAFVTDPDGRAIAVIDLERVEVIEHIDLDFAPVGIAWLGAASEGQDHTH